MAIASGWAGYVLAQPLIQGTNLHRPRNDTNRHSDWNHPAWQYYSSHLHLHSDLRLTVYKAVLKTGLWVYFFLHFEL